MVTVFSCRAGKLKGVAWNAAYRSVVHNSFATSTYFSLVGFLVKLYVQCESGVVDRQGSSLAWISSEGIESDAGFDRGTREFV